MSFNPDFLQSQTGDVQVNELLKYLQTQSPEILAQVAKSATNEVKDIIAHNIQGLLGVLPGEHFNVQITTDRENLAHLLGSAMMTGYFLRQMVQRMELEELIGGSINLNQEDK